MALVITSPDGDYIAKPPPPPPPPPPRPPQPPVQPKTHSVQGAAAKITTATTRISAGRDERGGGDGLFDGTVLVLRTAAALAAFVAVALVASCRHGGWMEFTRYQEFRYLLGVAVVAFLYSGAQALRQFRRIRREARSASVLDFACDQAVAYLLITASAAALPITIRMRSAVVNIFTDAIAASICLGFVAFAALAMSAILSGCKLSRQAYYS